MLQRIATLLFGCMLLTYPANPVSAEPAKRLAIVVQSSPGATHQSKLTVISGPMLDRIVKRSVKSKAGHIPVSDVYVTIEHPKLQGTYIMDRSGTLYDAENGEALKFPGALKARLRQYADSLRAAHYGTLMPWDVAKEIVSRKSKFTVIDLESGLRFNVQRRAGKHHADVQPLSKEDTQTMKRVYGGEWSWKRRAILVHKDGRFIAASMNGMPHGGDGISGNAFSGHFCIHFLDSVTHGSGNKDPDHQLMVYRAAGKLEEYFRGLTPDELVRVFMTALHEKDSQLLEMSFAPGNGNQLESFLENMGNVKAVRQRSSLPVSDTAGLLLTEIPVETEIYRVGTGKQKTTLYFQLQKTWNDGWKIGCIHTISRSARLR